LADFSFFFDATLSMNRRLSFLRHFMLFRLLSSPLLTFIVTLRH